MADSSPPPPRSSTALHILEHAKMADCAGSFRDFAGSASHQAIHLSTMIIDCKIRSSGAESKTVRLRSRCGMIAGACHLAEAVTDQVDMAMPDQHLQHRVPASASFARSNLIHALAENTDGENRMATVLVIDDDRSIPRLVEGALRDSDVNGRSGRDGRGRPGADRSARARRDPAGRDAARHGWAGGVSPNPRAGAEGARDFHHGRRRERHGHRGDEARARPTIWSSRSSWRRCRK